jgi:hypothetical protein
MKRLPPIMPIAVCWCTLIVCANASENREPVPTLVEEIESLFEQLDSDEFSVRNTAFERLQELSTHEDTRRLLAESVQRAIVDAEISFEVRRQLERLGRNLPRTTLPPALTIDADTVDQLLAQLGDDSYARRLGARSRLQWLLKNPEAVGLIYERLKLCASDAHLTREQTQSLRLIYDDARAAWLADEARKSDPPVLAERIDQLVGRLADVGQGKVFPLTGEPSVLAELQDLLAIEANVAPIREALEERIAAGGISSESAEHLNDMLDLTKPALVAEYWRSGRHENIQRLLVGVPSVIENQGASHFDRIDDQTAHCVSGVNLSEGDYPVGVAFPHPNERNSLFHLVNLPTPRRRLLYEYRVNEDEAGRYAALVTRTLDRYLTQKIPIDERDLSMIMQFGPREVSRFAGRYLTGVDDRKVVLQTPSGVTPSTSAVVMREGPSIHGLLCSWLASKGTQDAVPGLLKAIEENRLLPPSETSPCRFDRFAALAIARRDPWPGVDDWLAKVLSKNEPLVLGQEEIPELGATAASLLLRRYGGNVDQFDLIPCGDGYARRYGLRAYRYGTTETSQSVAEWWKNRKAEIDRQEALTEAQRIPREPSPPSNRSGREMRTPSEADVYQRLHDLHEQEHQEKSR